MPGVVVWLTLALASIVAEAVAIASDVCLALALTKMVARSIAVAVITFLAVGAAKPRTVAFVRYFEPR